MIEFLRADWWVPRYHCGYFPAWLIALHIAANLLIFMSYMAIPYVLEKMAQRGQSILNLKMTKGFKLFIGACGLGHLFGNVFVFFWPHYAFFGVWDFLTALISVRVAWLLLHTNQYVLTVQEHKNIQALQIQVGDIRIEGTLAEMRADLKMLKEAADKIPDRFESEG